LALVDRSLDVPLDIDELKEARPMLVRWGRRRAERLMGLSDIVGVPKDRDRFGQQRGDPRADQDVRGA
jgi:hypothetical protein